MGPSHVGVNILISYVLSEESGFVALLFRLILVLLRCLVHLGSKAVQLSHLLLRLLLELLDVEALFEDLALVALSQLLPYGHYSDLLLLYGVEWLLLKHVSDGF